MKPQLLELLQTFATQAKALDITTDAIKALYSATPTKQQEALWLSIKEKLTELKTPAYAVSKLRAALGIKAAHGGGKKTIMEDPFVPTEDGTTFEDSEFRPLFEALAPHIRKLAADKKVTTGNIMIRLATFVRNELAKPAPATKKATKKAKVA
jgi:hypothetical protein